LSFRVIDGDGVPTSGDAMIELWQERTPPAATGILWTRARPQRAGFMGSVAWKPTAMAPARSRRSSRDGFGRRTAICRPSTSMCWCSRAVF
jgi:hypothetical protein